MTRSIYDELVAAGAPELDLAAGEFYRVEIQEDSMVGYSGHVVSIRTRNLKKTHWWQRSSWQVYPSSVRVDVPSIMKRDDVSEVKVLARACQDSLKRIESQREHQRKLRASERLLGDHP